MKFPESSYTIQVPATTANLGPGFDMFGLALNQYGTFMIRFLEEQSYPLEDGEGNPIPIPPEKNFIKEGFDRALTLASYQGPIPGIFAKVTMDLPTGSGFGSSASAYAAGVVASGIFLKEMGHSPLSLEQELSLLNELEGHPDNAIPARLGGFVFSVFYPDRPPVIVRKEIPVSLGLGVIIPSFQVSTPESRSRLPGSYPLTDVLASMQGAALWMEYLNTGDPAILKAAIGQDRIHEPYRKLNIPGYDGILQATLEAGGYGITISGSGPGILVYFEREKKSEFTGSFSELLKKIEESTGKTYSFRACQADYRGAQVLAG